MRACGYMMDVSPGEACEFNSVPRDCGGNFRIEHQPSLGLFLEEEPECSILSLSSALWAPPGTSATYDQFMAAIATECPAGNQQRSLGWELKTS